MQTRFSLDQLPEDTGQLRLSQVSKHLIRSRPGKLLSPANLPNTSPREAAGDLPERRLAQLIGTDAPGFGIEARGATERFTTFDSGGHANCAGCIKSSRSSFRASCHSDPHSHWSTR